MPGDYSRCFVKVGIGDSHLLAHQISLIARMISLFSMMSGSVLSAMF